MSEHGIADYVARPSNSSSESVQAFVNESNYSCYGPDYFLGGPSKVVVDTLFSYRRLLEGLLAIPHVKFLPLRDLARGPASEADISVAVRHDIDSDLVAGLRQAEIEQRMGIHTTWCILHTAPYYGQFSSKGFLRHQVVAGACRRFQELGHEVALHIDPLSVYQQHKMDGAMALEAELRWLRSEGIDIVGAVSHGSRAAYGAENYEIFKGPLGGFNTNNEVWHNGTWAPLRVLDEDSLGLVYEANELFRRYRAPYEYGATRGVNLWRWVPSKERHGAQEESSRSRFWDQEQVLADCRRILPGSILQLVVHPCYYGCRHGPLHAPPMRLTRVATGPSPRLGWITYLPNTAQCVATPSEGPQEYQAINMSNEHGMLDKPWQDLAEKQGELRLLVVGGDNIDGSRVAIECQFHSILRKMLQERLSRPVKVRKLAFPGMGVSQLLAWCQALWTTARPHVILLGVGSQVFRHNFPEIWAAERGFSPSHPPGEYLAWDAGGARVVSIKASEGWRARQRKPRRLQFWPGTEVPTGRIMGGGNPKILGNLVAQAVELHRFVRNWACERHARSLLVVEELGESGGLWSADVSAGEREAFGRKALAVIEAIAGQADMPLCNPYAAFASEPNGLPAHFSREAVWNPTGHRLAAECAAGFVVRVLQGDGGGAVSS